MTVEMRVLMDYRFGLTLPRTLYHFRYVCAMNTFVSTDTHMLTGAIIFGRRKRQYQCSNISWGDYFESHKEMSSVASHKGRTSWLKRSCSTDSPSWASWHRLSEGRGLGSLWIARSVAVPDAQLQQHRVCI